MVTELDIKEARAKLPMPSKFIGEEYIVPLPFKAELVLDRNSVPRPQKELRFKKVYIGKVAVDWALQELPD